MSQQELNTISETPNTSAADSQLAMVYRNEYDEVALIAKSEQSLADAGYGGLLSVLVMTLLAMVVISRRPTNT
ncbi:MAG TPA: hypothetical protein DD979_16675 [Gammaproteobacteria bacterium]|jgi:hypothetical protein|nr:hypothetical protein [Gammaproteobacteria bacterium]